MRRLLHLGLWPLVVWVSFIPYYLGLSADLVQSGIITLVVGYLLFRQLALPRLLRDHEILVIDIDVFFATTLIVLFVNLMDGIRSEFFFFYYFLGLGVALLLDSVASVSMILAVIAGYAFKLPSDTLSIAIISALRLLSLFFTIPLAAFFASSYLSREEQKKKIFILVKEQKKYEQLQGVHQVLEGIERNFIARTAFNLKTSLSNIKNYLSYLVEEDEQNHNLNPVQKMCAERMEISNQQAIEEVKKLEKSFEASMGIDEETTQPVPSIYQRNSPHVLNSRNKGASEPNESML